MKQILFALFILLITCFIFKNKDGFCLNDEDTDQSMLDNIVATCPPNLGVNDIREMHNDESHINDNCLCSIKFLVESCTDDGGNVIDTEMIDKFNNLYSDNIFYGDNYPLSWGWLTDSSSRGGARYISGNFNCTKIRGGPTTNRTPPTLPSDDNEYCNNMELVNRFARWKYQGAGYRDREMCVPDESLLDGGRTGRDINYKCKYLTGTRNECVQDPDCLVMECPIGGPLPTWQPHNSCRDDRIREIFNNLPDSSGYNTNEICAGSGNSTREECTSITNRDDCWGNCTRVTCY